MRKHILMATLLSAVTLVLVLARAKKIAVQSTSLESPVRAEFEFGVCAPGDAIRHDFTLANPSTEPMRVGPIGTSCPCMEATCEVAVIAPNEKAVVSVLFKTHGLAGQQRRPVFVHCSASNEPIVFMLTGTVVPRLHIAPRIVQVATGRRQAPSTGVHCVDVSAPADLEVRVAHCPSALGWSIGPVTEKEGTRTTQFQFIPNAIDGGMAPGAYSVMFSADSARGVAELATVSFIVDSADWLVVSPGVILLSAGAGTHEVVLRLQSGDGRAVPVAIVEATCPEVLKRVHIAEGLARVVITTASTSGNRSGTGSLIVSDDSGRRCSVPIMVCDE